MKRSKKIAALVLSALSFIQSMPNPQAMLHSPSVSTTQSASTMERFEQMILSAIKHGSVNAIICVYGRLCRLRDVSCLNVFFTLVIESGNAQVINALFGAVVESKSDLAITALFETVVKSTNALTLTALFEAMVKSTDLGTLHALIAPVVKSTNASAVSALFEAIVKSTNQVPLHAFITAVTASGTDVATERMFKAMEQSSPCSSAVTSTWADIAVSFLTASDARHETSSPCATTAVAESPGPNSDRNVPSPIVLPPALPPARATADSDEIAPPSSAASLGFTIVDAVPSIAPAVPTVNKRPLPTEPAGEYVAAGYADADGDDNDDDDASEATPERQSASNCKRLSDAPAASESKHPRTASRTPTSSSQPPSKKKRSLSEEEQKWFGVPRSGARTAHYHKWINKRDAEQNQILEDGISAMKRLVECWCSTTNLGDARERCMLTDIDDAQTETDINFGKLWKSICSILNQVTGYYRKTTPVENMESVKKGLLLVRDFHRTLYQYHLIHKCQDSPAGSASFITALSNFRTTLKAVVIQRLGENFWNDLITRSDEKQEEKEEEKDPATPPSPPAVDTNFLD